jgi:hypothetical protein
MKPPRLRSRPADRSPGVSAVDSTDGGAAGPWSTGWEDGADAEGSAAASSIGSAGSAASAGSTRHTDSAGSLGSAGSRDGSGSSLGLRRKNRGNLPISRQLPLHASS